MLPSILLCHEELDGSGQLIRACPSLQPCQARAVAVSLRPWEHTHIRFLKCNLETEDSAVGPRPLLDPGHLSARFSGPGGR